MENLKTNAKNLRKNMTDQEKKIWSIIRNRQFYNFRFLRQCIIGNYIVDFLCKARKIIIEIDGGQHNENLNKNYDNKRTMYFESKGYKVVRFWNNEIDSNIKGVFLNLKEVFNIED